MSNSIEYIRSRLFELKDESYAEFQAKLTPGIGRECFIGVRVPLLKSFAKECLILDDIDSFLKDLPHRYYEENMLHGLILAKEKDYDKTVEKMEVFLPYIDNWAVCDSIRPVSFSKHKEELLGKIKEWISSDKPFTIRFGIEMLMIHYLSSDFRKEYLLLPKSVQDETYYVKMMIAWYYATALAFRWEETIKILEEKSLSPWVQNKTIQKAIESYRITDKQKIYLRSLKL